MKTIILTALVFLWARAIAQTVGPSPDPGILEGDWMECSGVDPIDDSVYSQIVLFEHVHLKDDPQIMIRFLDGRVDIMLIAGEKVGKDDREVTIRWDSAPAVKQKWAGCTSGTDLFCPPESAAAFVKSLSISKKLAIRFTGSNGLESTAVYDLSGFEKVAAPLGGVSAIMDKLSKQAVSH